MEHIKFELAKKLNELWLLDNIDTEFVYNDYWTIYFADDIKFVDTRKECNKIHNCEPYYIFHNANSYAIQNQKNEWFIYKTLTTEEVVEFLPKTYIDKDWLIYRLTIIRDSKWLIMYWDEQDNTKVNSTWETFLEAIEQMIEFLIDNNLLWQQQ